MSARSLVVSIHNVSPFTRDTVVSILDRLARAGVGRVSLLVVPDHHRGGNITMVPDFGFWLRGMVAAGHEPVLHGFHHQRESRPQESARTRFFTRHYTAGEGEFFDISYDATRALLERGRSDLAECAGIAPDGFIAPAWLLSREGEAAADLGFAYTTRLKTVSDFTTGRLHRSQSLCWSVRNLWRRAISPCWNRFLFQRLRENPLMRISIDPPDFTYKKIWRQIESLLARALEDREPITYGDFVNRQAGA